MPVRLVLIVEMTCYEDLMKRPVPTIIAALLAGSFACLESSSNDVASGVDAGSDATPALDAGSDATRVDGGLETPPFGELIGGLELFDGWTEPRALPAPVNSDGWEDSSFIAASGRRLYFGYTRLDYDALMAPPDGGPVALVTGADRPGQHGAGFDVYEATFGAGTWTVVNSSVNAAGDVMEAASSVTGDERTMIFARFEGATSDLYAARRTGMSEPWSAAELLPAPISTSCVEDNPHVTDDGQILMFDSDRTDALGAGCAAGGPRDIWMSRWDGASFGVPVRVSDATTFGPLRVQPFATDGGSDLYFTGLDDADPTRACIYRVHRRAEGTYGDRVLVARAKNRDQAGVGEAIAIGEVSITKDGAYMYFTFIRRSAAGRDDVSLGLAHRP